VLTVMAWKATAETFPHSFDRSVSKIKISEVVTVDHRKNLFRLIVVVLWILMHLLVRGSLNVVTIVRDETLGVLFRLPKVAAEWRRDSS